MPLLPTVAAAPEGAAGIALGVLLASIWVVVIWETRRKTGKPRTAGTAMLDAVVAIVLLVSIALLPVRLHAFIVAVAILGLFGLSALWLVWRVAFDAKLLRMRRAMKRGTTGVSGPDRAGPVSEDMWLPVPAFESEGFTRLMTEAKPRLEMIVLFRSTDSTFAEVARSPTWPGQPLVLELTSVLLGRRGLVCTSTFGLRPRLWAGELRQIFPGSTPGQLVANHEAAMAFLADRGILPDAVDVAGALGLRDGMMARASIAGSTVAIRTLRKEAIRAARREPADVGRLEAQPDIDARLGAFWSAVRTN